MLTQMQLIRSLAEASRGDKVVFVCPTRSRAKRVMHEIENILVDAKATNWRILPGQKVLEIGAGEVMVKSLKDGNGYLTGLKVQKVYLDDCWIDGLL